MKKQHWSSSSNNQQWTITTVTGSQKAVNVETAENPKIELYPNPSSTSFNLRFDNSNVVTRVAIFDMMGKQVDTIEQSEITSNTVVCSSLKPNLYVIQVYGSNWTKSFKVIKK